jgi:mitogen-activated protein kinase 1/3
VFCLRTLRELKLLRYFAEQNVSENVRLPRPGEEEEGAEPFVSLVRCSSQIISIVDIIKPTSIESFKEVCSGFYFALLVRKLTLGPISLRRCTSSKS